MRDVLRYVTESESESHRAQGALLQRKKKTRLLAGFLLHQVAAVEEFFDLSSEQRFDALALLE